MNRKLSFDILRIFAAFNIVLVHVTSNYMLVLPIGSGAYRFALFANSLTKFAVPAFVMISGAIFLSEDYKVNVKRLWTHNILRLAVAYIIWSFIYYAGQSIFIWNYDFLRQGIVRTVTGMIYASEHFWFIFMLMGLYALVPVIKTWITKADKKEEEYLIVLFVIFQIVRYTVATLVDKSLIQEIAGLVQITELSRYLGYFVLGHYINTYGIKGIVEKAVYAIAAIGIPANYFIALILSEKAGYTNVAFYDSFGFFSFAESVAIFALTVKYINPGASEKTSKLIIGISNDTMGIYLMHVLILLIMYNKGVFSVIPAAAGIPLFTIGTFLICTLVSAVLRRIPKVGRYIC